MTDAVQAMNLNPNIAGEIAALLEPYQWDDAIRRDPRPAYRTLGAHGLLAPSWPVDLGGRGLTHVDDCTVLETLISSGIPDTLYVTSVQVVGDVLLHSTSSTLRTRMLREIAAGKAFGSVFFSEPAAGSDLASITTGGVFDNETIRIDGTKCWSVSTPLATHGLCAFRDIESVAGRYRDLCLAIVPLSTPGVEILPLETVQPEVLHEIRLRSVTIPADHLVGTRGEAWPIISGSISAERTGIDYLGRARRWLDALGTLVSSTVTQDLEDRYRGARALAHHEADLVDIRMARDGDAAVVKLVCSELAQDIAHRAAEHCRVEEPAKTTEQQILHLAWREAPGLTMSAGASEVLVDLAASSIPDSALDEW